MPGSLGSVYRYLGAIRPAYSWDSANDPDVTYVIIGNGFDLECGLPTSYRSFLEFVSEGRCATLPHVTMTKPVDWDALRDYNFWFKRFASIQVGSGWVDFENEIDRVITTIERKMGSQAFMDDRLPRSSTSSGYSVFDEICGSIPITRSTIATYRDLVRRLQDDLNSLTRGLEAYLHDYLGERKPKETETVKGLVNRLSARSNVHVISFNYTRTLEDMLVERGVKAEFCYVHGTVGDGSEKNRMVLGINEHRGDGGAEVPVEFGPFKKYNQRIYKQTDSSYMNWLADARSPYERARQIEQIENELLTSASGQIDMRDTRNRCVLLKNECQKEMRNSEVIVFGHSLGVTDEDILRAFFTLPDTRTVVYRHEDEAFSEQVSNMAVILDTDEVITRTGGKGRTLEFRDQSDLRTDM